MSNRLVTFVAVTACLTVAFPVAGQRKEDDGNVNYDEARVPDYELPPLLVTAEGRRVETAEQWRNVRRPQILSLFSNLIYGRVPESPHPIDTRYETVRTDQEFLGGKAARRDVKIRFSNDKGSAEMLILVFTPNGAAEAVPAILKHSFDNTESAKFDVDPERPGLLRNGWPIAEILGRGFGFVAVYQQDLVAHNEVEFRKGIHPLFYREGQSFLSLEVDGPRRWVPDLPSP